MNRTVNQTRIQNGKKMRARYPTMLSRVESIYGVPPHVILAFWGMESNYGEIKSRHKLTNAFLTLMYDGRREKFFTNQLIALMKIADKNHLDINNIHGSWAGAMGHFQFIPTTLAQYGVDGNGDNSIDVINSVGDAMFSAGNYLHKLGWNPNERIARHVILPADFDTSLLRGDVKKPLSEWAAMGVVNPDGTPIPTNNMVAGLVADVAAIDAARETDVENISPDTDVAPMPVITAYLTYPNFYRIKKWNNSNWYAIAIAELSDKLK
jgi:membrane-bound lytic murein transglycosylase B